jgi:signal transduction histidine kinase
MRLVISRTQPGLADARGGTVRVQRGVAFGRSALAVRLAAAGIVAVGAELALVAASRGLPADPAWTPIALAVAVFALAAFLRPFEPAPGEKFSLAAAAAFFGALVLPGVFAVVAVGVAALVAKIAQRRSPLSTAVNVAQVAGATAAGSLAAATAAGGTSIVAAGASYLAVTLASVAVMIAASQSARSAGSFLRREAMPTAALIGVGGIASIVWSHEPVVLLLFVPVLATIEIATRRAAAERTALAARDRAERAQREFALDAAHELRTPLTSVIGDLDFLRGLSLPAAEAAALSGARSEARRAAGLVERLLLLARAGAEVEPLPSDAAEAARQVVARAATAATVPIELDAEGPLPVPIPRELLDVLVGDLVQNATTYTREGRIAVSVRRSGPRVEIVVADTGIGIPREELARVFDRFYRGARARVMSPGTGLGLSIVRRILETHDGDIAIDSAPGRGTTVTVRLPAAP